MLRNTSQHTGQFVVQNPNRSKLSTGRDIRDVNCSIPHHLLGLLLESPSVRANSLMGANLSEHSRLSYDVALPRGHTSQVRALVSHPRKHTGGVVVLPARVLLPDHSPSLQLYLLEAMPTALPVSLLTPLTPGICPFFAVSAAAHPVLTQEGQHSAPPRCSLQHPGLSSLSLHLAKLLPSLQPLWP